MTRGIFLTLFAAGAAGLAGAVRAELPVAPAPREVRPDGTRDPAPKPDAPAAEDPAAVVDRIIKNSKDVGDKLAATDTGDATRGTQGKILADIDALINRQENPPPPKPDDNKDQEKDKNDQQNKDDKKENKDKSDQKDMGKDPMSKGDIPPPKGDMPMDKKGMGGTSKDEGMPMGGMTDPPPMPLGGNGRRPRMGEPNADKKEPNGQPQPDPMKGDGQKQPAAPKDGKDPKSPSGAVGGNPGGKGTPKALLPLEEDVTKDVWGHLPDKLRQQMTQYYKEDVMPKYAELLRLYYSSMAEKGAGPRPPRR